MCRNCTVLVFIIAYYKQGFDERILIFPETKVMHLNNCIFIGIKL